MLTTSLMIKSCGAPSNSEQKNIINEDTRVKVTSDVFPMSAMARIDSGCSGGIVGKHLVLTAAHSVLDGDGKPKRTGFIVRNKFKSGLASESHETESV